MTRITEDIGRAVFPATIVVALAILVRGYSHAGDGFSAGLLIGLGALVQYLAVGPKRAAKAVRADAAPRIAGAGLLLVIVTTLAPVLFGLPPVTHVPGPSAHVVELGSVKLHTAMAFDVGVLLLVYGCIVRIVDRLVREEPRGGAR